MKRMFWLSFVFCLFSLIFLISLISPKFISASSTVRFLYDGDGNRVAKIESGKTTLYVGDLEKDLTSGQVTKYYGLGGKRIAIKEGSSLSFLVSDHLGSLRTLSSLSNLLAPNESAPGGEVGGDLDASSIAKVSYYPYGSVRTKSDNLPSRQYTGQINDEQTGLYFYNARYYNPQNGNFLTVDLIKKAERNPYTYASGNPLLYLDPSGMDDESFLPPQDDDDHGGSLLNDCQWIGSAECPSWFFEKFDETKFLEYYNSVIKALFALGISDPSSLSLKNTGEKRLLLKTMRKNLDDYGINIISKDLPGLKQAPAKFGAAYHPAFNVLILPGVEDMPEEDLDFNIDSFIHETIHYFQLNVPGWQKSTVQTNNSGKIQYTPGGRGSIFDAPISRFFSLSLRDKEGGAFAGSYVITSMIEGMLPKIWDLRYLNTFYGTNLSRHSLFSSEAIFKMKKMLSPNEY